MGRATALAFARAGVQGLALGDLNEPGVQETAKQAKQVATNPKFAITASHVDVRSWASVDAFFLAAFAKFRRIDYSVTTAGVRISSFDFGDESFVCWFKLTHIDVSFSDIFPDWSHCR